MNLGRCLRTLVSLDAFCVLSGGVLTAYVGIEGLLYQMGECACYWTTRREAAARLF